MGIDPATVDEFMGRFVADLGAVLHAGTVVVGEKLGLYRALAQGPMTATQLAAKTDTDEAYVREWLAAQAASGYVTYDAESRRFGLNDVQALLLAAEGGPAYVPGAFQVAVGALKSLAGIIEAGLPSNAANDLGLDRPVYEGAERFFLPRYCASLLSSWIPALEGVEAKLIAGARVAQVGCLDGASTILLAQAYPRSTFIGFDRRHGRSIERARNRAPKAGVADRVSFEIGSLTDFPGVGYDLVIGFNCLHHVPDAAAAAAHVRSALQPDGTWMIVERGVDEDIEDNLNSVGRVHYCTSTMIWPSQSTVSRPAGEPTASTQETRVRRAVDSGGFGRFRRATQTPYHVVLEARP
jgi:SAM-dependent methyltransferase